MRTILSLRGHRYLRTFGSFLIVIALVAGIASCVPVEKYELAMAVDPAGGGTATDETGTSPYAEGTVVNITAVAGPCYRFVSWTAPAGTFGNATAAETTFTMPAQDVTVTANFEPTLLDHFKFYGLDEGTAPYVGKDVQLVDQFGAFNVTVGDARNFGTPVEKVHNDDVTPISDPNRHYTLYELDYGEGEPMLDSWQVVVNNQFQDNQELTLWGPIALAVPTTKEGHEDPVCLDHFLLYEVLMGPSVQVTVGLNDQFTEEDVVVYEPLAFANPVQKTVDGEVTEIATDEHLVFYRIEGAPFSTTVQIDNQFGPQTLDVTIPQLLAVPSQKISWERPLDHFKCYGVSGGLAPEEEVQLEDQFVTINATVGQPVFFANPTRKGHDEVWTQVSNWDNHLTLYGIDYEGDYQGWSVTVNNQFGDDQVLTVYGPLGLMVPTRKGDQDPPVGLDHFLLYGVVISEPYSATVYLEDQWTSGIIDVGEALYFATPVQKTHGDVVTPIKYPTEHLVFYMIGEGTYSITDLPIANQFGPQVLPFVFDDVEFLNLGVPSEMTYWEPWEP